jgi:hypothetical protein
MCIYMCVCVYILAVCVCYVSVFFVSGVRERKERRAVGMCGGMGVGEEAADGPRNRSLSLVVNTHAHELPLDTLCF